MDPILRTPEPQIVEPYLDEQQFKNDEDNLKYYKNAGSAKPGTLVDNEEDRDEISTLVTSLKPSFDSTEITSVLRSNKSGSLNGNGCKINMKGRILISSFQYSYNKSKTLKANASSPNKICDVFK